MSGIFPFKNSGIKLIFDKFKWSVIGQQILLSPTVLPKIFSELDKNSFPKFLHKYLKIGGMDIPYNTDSWDGYPKERNKLLKILSKAQSSIVLTGDTHNSWISNLFGDSQNFIGVEIAAPSISSPNSVDLFKSITNDIDQGFIKQNENLKWANGSGKGFVKLVIDSNQIEAKFMYVSNIKSKQYQLTDTNRFIIKHNQPL